MKRIIPIVIIVLVLASAGILISAQKQTNSRFVTYIVNPKKQDVKLYWKSEGGENFGSIKNLVAQLKRHDKKVLFAMNGGMYKKNHSPQGLYIEDGKMYSALDIANGGGNFYLKPNGVFYLDRAKKAAIVTTEKFNNQNVGYATQSGPMLIINGEVHPGFSKGSANLNIRNGVGILPDGNVVFAMSKNEINFYDFADYFKSLGCKNALYLDGLVSRTYLPEENWLQTDGNFGVIIGVTEK